MAFLIKSMVGNPLKGMGLGGGEEKTEQDTPKDPAAAAGMTREEYEDYQKQLVEEKMQRDADFLHKKAERATLRVCLREKYRLPKVRLFETKVAKALGLERRVWVRSHRYMHAEWLRIHLDLKAQGLALNSKQSEQDENMIQMAGDDVDVPEELLKMVDEDATEEEEKDSVLGHIQNLQNMDMEQIKEKASATFTEMKSKAEEKCTVM